MNHYPAQLNRRTSIGTFKRWKCDLAPVAFGGALSLMLLAGAVGTPEGGFASGAFPGPAKARVPASHIISSISMKSHPSPCGSDERRASSACIALRRCASSAGCSSGKDMLPSPLARRNSSWLGSRRSKTRNHWSVAHPNTLDNRFSIKNTLAVLLPVPSLYITQFKIASCYPYNCRRFTPHVEREMPQAYGFNLTAPGVFRCLSFTAERWRSFSSRTPS